MPTTGGSKSTEEVVIVTMPANARQAFEDSPDWKLAFVGCDEQGRRVIAIFEEGEQPA